MKNPYEALDEIAQKDNIVKIFMDTFPVYVDSLNRYLESHGYKLAVCKVDEINYDNEEWLEKMLKKYK